MSQRSSHGFTLIELIMVIVILGILSVGVVPRFFNPVGFDARGFFDESKSTVRYAQKLAIAQRRTVFVNIVTNVTPNIICLTYDVQDLNCNTGPFVQNPGDMQLFVRTAPRSGVNFGAASSFSFSPLGRPSAAQVINIVGDGMTRSVTVESETGYVH